MSCETQEAPNPYGQICWLEIPVSDPARAAKFYTSIFEWECSAPEGAMPSPVAGVKTVHMFSKGNLNGAFLLMEEGHQITNFDKEEKYRMAAMPTFCVRSIEDTVAKVEKLGGRVHVPKTEIGGGMGFFCRFVDSEGNLVGMWAQN